MKSKSQVLADKIEAMKAELAAVKAAESEAADQELLRLVHRAGIRDKMIQFAREQIDLKRGERSGAHAE